MGIKTPVTSTVYYTIAHILLCFLYQISILLQEFCEFVQLGGCEWRG